MEASEDILDLAGVSWRHLRGLSSAEWAYRYSITKFIIRPLIASQAGHLSKNNDVPHGGGNLPPNFIVQKLSCWWLWRPFQFADLTNKKVVSYLHKLYTNNPQLVGFAEHELTSIHICTSIKNSMGTHYICLIEKLSLFTSETCLCWKDAQSLNHNMTDRYTDILRDCRRTMQDAFHILGDLHHNWPCNWPWYEMPRQPFHSAKNYPFQPGMTCKGALNTASSSWLWRGCCWKFHCILV